MTTSSNLGVVRLGPQARVHHHAGCGLYYNLFGSGPPVLFIQGVGVHGDGWLPQTEALNPRFTCLSFDNRGMGKSQPSFLAITVEQMAEDARALMHVAGWRSAHLVGHSLGGLVALQLALSDPGRVRSLSLLCSFANGRAATPMTPRMMWLGLRSRLGTRAMRRNGFLERILPPKGMGKVPVEEIVEELPGLFGHDLSEQPPIVEAQYRAMRECNLAPLLGGLTAIPTLVMFGRHDPVAPPSASREIAAGIPGSRLVEFEDASHGLPITHDEDVNGLLESHLASAEQRWTKRVFMGG